MDALFAFSRLNFSVRPVMMLVSLSSPMNITATLLHQHQEKDCVLTNLPLTAVRWLPPGDAVMSAIHSGHTPVLLGNIRGRIFVSLGLRPENPFVRKLVDEFGTTIPAMCKIF
jgi:hypothetical protein